MSGVQERLSTVSALWLTRPVKRIRHHLRTPLYANAYCLMASTAINSVLGFLFWTAAARLYTAEEVGIASAAISAVMLLAGLSSLGLETGLIRFLPEAGGMSVRMLDSVLTSVSISSLVCIAVFLAGLPLWSPALTFMYGRPGFLVTVGLLAVMTAVGRVIDGTFIAYRIAGFVLLCQGIQNGAKIPLLMVFLAVGGAFGIVASLAVGTGVALAIALAWCLPCTQEGYAPRPRISRGVLSDILPYAVGNHLADLLAQSPQIVLPLMILHVLGPSESGHSYVTWMIANLIFAVPRSIATSTFAEAANAGGALRRDVKRASLLILLVLVPALILALLAGNRVLLIFGREYAAEGRGLLPILACSAVPVAVNNVYLAVNRVRKETWRNFAVALTIAGVTLGLSNLLMTGHGIVGAGVGWLVGQGVASALVVYSAWRRAKRTTHGQM